jgi:hypothetical protein
MIKKWLISKAFKIVVGIIVLGIGIWYLSSSIGGASLSYTSVNTFMEQIGAGNSGETGVPGCFLCGYIRELFAIMGNATEMFWTGIVHNLWILMAIGFGIFLGYHTIQMLREQATSKDVKNLTSGEPQLDFKKWFDRVWKTGARVLLAGALIGALNWAGTGALRTVTNFTITPVMYIGSALSSAATGVVSGKTCETTQTAQKDTDILNPVLEPFMCVMNNLNMVMLAGAGGGFALMNYGWLNEHGGGVFTWLSGLALVIMFLVIGFDLLFQVLSVLFKLIFIIIFMPLLLAAVGFEQVWGLAKGLMNSAISMLVNSAVSILKISLKICIIYAIVYFSADTFYPEPQDGFTTILPPLLSEITPNSNKDSQTLSVMNAFSTCEQKALINGEMDKDKFKTCFKQQQAIVEAKYPGAFKFMSDGFDFFIFMVGVFLLYFWVISPQIDSLLGSKDGKETFDYGQWVKDFGKMTANAPEKIYTSIKNVIDKGK